MKGSDISRIAVTPEIKNFLDKCFEVAHTASKMAALKIELDKAFEIMSPDLSDTTFKEIKKKSDLISEPEINKLIAENKNAASSVFITKPSASIINFLEYKKQKENENE